MVKDNSISTKILTIMVHITMIFVIVVTLYPVLNVFASSLSSADANNKGIVTIFPIGFTWDSYRMIFTAGTVPRAFKNSVIYTVVEQL